MRDRRLPAPRAARAVEAQRHVDGGTEAVVYKRREYMLLQLQRTVGNQATLSAIQRVGTPTTEQSSPQEWAAEEKDLQDELAQQPTAKRGDVIEKRLKLIRKWRLLASPARYTPPTTGKPSTAGIIRARTRTETAETYADFSRGLDQLLGLHHEWIDLILDIAAIAMSTGATQWRTGIPESEDISKLLPVPPAEGWASTGDKIVWLASEAEMGLTTLHEYTHLALDFVIKNGGEPFPESAPERATPEFLVAVQKEEKEAKVKARDNSDKVAAIVKQVFKELEEEYKGKGLSREILPHVSEMLVHTLTQYPKNVNDLKKTIPFLYDFMDKNVIAPLKVERDKHRGSMTFANEVVWPELDNAASKQAEIAQKLPTLNATDAMYPSLEKLSQAFKELVGSFTWLRTSLERRKTAPAKLIETVRDDLAQIDQDASTVKNALDRRSEELTTTLAKDLTHRRGVLWLSQFTEARQELEKLLGTIS
jgi:hypothetical protein